MSFLDLPKSVEISGPTTATPGEYAHFTCLTTESFPVPALKWKVEKSGDGHEVIDIDGDVSTEASEDGGVVTFAKIDILIEEGITHASVQCSALLEGFGKESSKQHEIDVIAIEKPIQTLEYKENEDSSIETLYSDISEETDVSYEDQKEEPAVVKLMTLEKRPEFEGQERSKLLWIPLKPVEDIEDYQHAFASNNDEMIEDTDNEEEFFRASDIPEAPMLKQEKGAKTAVVNSPVPISMVYSSSSRISIQSMWFTVALTLLMLSR